MILRREHHQARRHPELLQRVERPDRLRLGQPEVLRPVDEQLRRAPVRDVVRGAEFLREGFGLGVPRAAGPLVVELRVVGLGCQWEWEWKWEWDGTYEEELVSAVPGESGLCERCR
jgi:hypothetical protein